MKLQNLFLVFTITLCSLTYAQGYSNSSYGNSTTSTSSSSINEYSSMPDSSSRNSTRSYASTYKTKFTSVSIRNHIFYPKTIKIRVGRKVRWYNYDDVDHTVISDDGKMASSPHIIPGGSISYQFTRPGTYYYHCSIHPEMRGKVIVR